MTRPMWIGPKRDCRFVTPNGVKVEVGIVGRSGQRTEAIDRATESGIPIHINTGVSGIDRDLKSISLGQAHRRAGVREGKQVSIVPDSGNGDRRIARSESDSAGLTNGESFGQRLPV